MDWRTDISKFMESLAARNATFNTIVAYRGDVTQFCEFLDTKLTSDAVWHDVTPEHVAEYIHDLSQRCSHRTTARKAAALKTFFRWLSHNTQVRDGLLDAAALPRFAENLAKAEQPVSPSQ